MKISTARFKRLIKEELFYRKFYRDSPTKEWDKQPTGLSLAKKSLGKPEDPVQSTK